MNPKMEGRNCNVTIKLAVNADIFGENFTLQIEAFPLAGHSTEPIKILHMGLGHDEEKARLYFDMARTIMYAIQANDNIKFLEPSNFNEAKRIIDELLKPLPKGLPDAMATVHISDLQAIQRALSSPV